MLPMELKETLLLPDPSFGIPMKADLTSREPEIQAKWDAMGIYHRIFESRAGAPSFVFHDGPPYTNGPIHLGTALNKMLKDFSVKSRTMMGYQVPMVPGFDNHGLPIEQAVAKAFADKKESPDIETFRTACREHARKYIKIQTDQFRRLGVFGLWEKPYVTMDFRYEAEIVRTFIRLVRNDQIYRGLRPVLWSPTARTALADTEIVYQEHTSKAIYVRFPLIEDPNGFFKQDRRVWTIIWTTTPWTIPANVAVAFHPELEYMLCRSGEDTYIVLASLAAQTMAKCGITDWVEEGLVIGSSLDGLKFKHPIFDRESVGVLADYVTTEDGTGVVHTAPGHGREDFITGMKYNLPVLCPVDEGGVLTAEAGEFAGTYYAKCDTVVVDRLRELGNLLHAEDHVHSYPHAERDNKPVIFRTTEQWFVSIDANDLRERMLSKLDDVEFHPPQSITRLQSMVKNRPDWCISRQRPWGVGIPIFYAMPSGTPVMDPEIMERVAKLVEEKGSDAWFVRDAATILPEGYRHPETGETEFRKETDVFDVWFDSGASSLCVLEGNVEPEWKAPWPADLYFEGSDQHRGWFNQSLVIGTAIRGESPFKAIVTHGFTVDANGVKMSKRLGNVIDPVTVCESSGADILRLWAASVSYSDDVPCSDDILKQIGDAYRRIRNTIRFLLMNLKDWDGGTQIRADVDQWIVDQTDLLVNDVVDAYRRYEFTAVTKGVHDFCVQQVSAFYLDAIKDSMYCDAQGAARRRSAQAACHYVASRLIKLLAPVLVHTAEEAYRALPHINHLDSVHMELIHSPSEARLDEIEGSDLQVRVAALLEFRSALFASFEEWKVVGGVKDSQDVLVKATVPADVRSALQSFGDDLANLLKVSGIELADGEFSASFERTPYLKCERSRICRPDVQERPNGHVLCDRCYAVVTGMSLA